METLKIVAEMSSKLILHALTFVSCFDIIVKTQKQQGGETN